MQVTLLRQVVAVAIAGSGLLFGGASVSKYFDQSPTLLYAAGELHMAFGDARGGVTLIGRAEAARTALKRNEKSPSVIEQTPAEKPTEVCTNQKHSENLPAPTLRQALAAPVVQAMVMPTLPAPPSFDGMQIDAPVPQMSFVNYNHDWHKGAHVVRVYRKFRVDAEQRAAIHQQRAALAEASSAKVDVGQIMKNVKEELARQNISTGALMLLEGPTAQ